MAVNGNDLMSQESPDAARTEALIEPGEEAARKGGQGYALRVTMMSSL